VCVVSVGSPRGRAGLKTLVATDTHLAAEIILLPVRACPTIYGLTTPPDGFPRYLPASRQAPPTATAVGSLAWFEGDTRRQSDLVLLGPPGWSCAALIAVDGSSGMTDSPPGTDPANLLKKQPEQVYMLMDYNGPGAGTACDYFPSAVSRSPAPQDCATPSRTTVTVEGPHLAAFQSQPRNRSSIVREGFVLWYPQATNGTAYVSCQLPIRKRALCPIILDEARKRLQARLVQIAAETARFTSHHH
jgi:hypothetical protein